MYLVSIFSDCIVLNICVLTFFKWLTKWDTKIWKKMKLNFQLLKVLCKPWFAIFSLVVALLLIDDVKHFISMSILYIYIYIYIYKYIYIYIFQLLTGVTERSVWSAVGFLDKFPLLLKLITFLIKNIHSY